MTHKAYAQFPRARIPARLEVPRGRRWNRTGLFLRLPDLVNHPQYGLARRNLESQFIRQSLSPFLEQLGVFSTQVERNSFCVYLLTHNLAHLGTVG